MSLKKSCFTVGNPRQCFQWLFHVLEIDFDFKIYFIFQQCQFPLLLLSKLRKCTWIFIARTYEVDGHTVFKWRKISTWIHAQVTHHLLLVHTHFKLFTLYILPNWQVFKDCSEVLNVPSVAELFVLFDGGWAPGINVGCWIFLH